MAASILSPPLLSFLLQLQLQEATYSPDTVTVLRRVAEEVEGAVGAATARLQQARFTFCCFYAL